MFRAHGGLGAGRADASVQQLREFTWACRLNESLNDGAGPPIAAQRAAKMSSGSSAVTPTLGASTSWAMRRSTATLATT